MHQNDYDQLTKQLNQSLAALLRDWIKQFSMASLVNSRISEQLTALNLANFKINVPDIYVGLSDFNLDRLTGIANLARQINEMINVSAFAQIHDVMSGYDLVTKRIVADLAVFQTISEQLSFTFSDIFVPFTEVKEVTEAFSAAGWPIAPSMSREFKVHVAAMHKDGKTRYISRTIIGYYHRNDFENLNKAVDSWAHNPLFVPRMHIFKAALKAHQEGDFVLSVPTLFPQVEGILNEYVHEADLSAQVGRIQQVYEAVLDDVDAFGLTSWAIMNALLSMFQNHIYVWTSFTDELRKSINNRRITRHTVLHGIAPNYDRPIHSLKLFVLLDALSQL